jgi:SH3-like domain-containing protein
MKLETVISTTSNRKIENRPQWPRFVLLLCLMLVAGCNHGTSSGKGEHAYVVAPQVALRDRVAAVYNKVGYVNNGDRVEVLDRSSNKRFVKVRTDDAKEGWIEQRYLASQTTFDGFQRLAEANNGAQSQASAITKRVVNMHLEPARDSDRLFQLKEGDKLELIKRAITPKNGVKAAITNKQDEEAKDREAEFEENRKNETAGAIKSPSGKPGKNALGKTAKNNEPVDPAKQMEDWWLVRDQRKRVGWVLGRMMDVDIPLEIAQYAEGQRIVASFVLNEVDDPNQNKKMPQFAVLMTPNKDGLPYDYEQLRIFTWNIKRNRYETAYHERFQAMLPFTVTKEPDKREGEIPVMTVRVTGKDGTMSERKYKMYGVMVRKVK